MVMNGRSLKNYRIKSHWSETENRREQASICPRTIVIYHVRVEVCDDECNNGNANKNNSDDDDGVGDNNDGYIHWIITSELVRGKIAWS